MDEPRLTIGRLLLPIAPFIVVIIAPNLVFLDASIDVEKRSGPVTHNYSDGRVVTESKWEDTNMVNLRWRFGPQVLSSSTTTVRSFADQTNSSTLEELNEAVSVSLVLARSWVAVCVFPIALIAWNVFGRVSHWHSCATVPSSRFFPPLYTVGACLGVLCVFVVGFALMKPLWPAGVSELVRWFGFNVNGLIPFISSVIICPVAEELVFRSGVCRLLVERIGPVAGIFLQALLFGSVHLATPLHMAVGFIGGIVLGMVYIYSRSNASMCGVLIFDCGLKAVQSP
jgi:membrane protease YdiL (CAAX protease family)